MLAPKDISLLFLEFKQHNNRQKKGRKEREEKGKKERELKRKENIKEDIKKEGKKKREIKNLVLFKSIFLTTNYLRKVCHLLKRFIS